MDIELNEEQALLRDSITAFMADRYPFQTRREIVASDAGWSRAIWRGLSEELGVLGIGFDEAQGGLGGGGTEIMVVMEALGRALAVEPVLGTLVIGGGFLRRSRTAAAAALTADIIAGRAVTALAYLEPQGRFNPFDVQTSAKRDGAGYRLNGHKAVVMGGPWADRLFVTARLGGAQTDAAGIGIFLLDRNARGVSRRDYASIDGQRACELYLENVVLPEEALLFGGDDGATMLEAVLDEAIAALCAEGVGVLKELQAATVGYVKERRQFGKAIGDFQVVRHRLVDMQVALEQLVSLTDAAAASLDLPAQDRAAAVSAAKVQLGQAGRLVGQGAVQLHGGMGQTDELSVGWYFKRATVMESQFGSTDFHLNRFRAALG
jgi:alkylation response protein AidB-like acyl-CoA dehydrogenase